MGTSVFYPACKAALADGPHKPLDPGLVALVKAALDVSTKRSFIADCHSPVQGVLRRMSSFGHDVEPLYRAEPPDGPFRVYRGRNYKNVDIRRNVY